MKDNTNKTNYNKEEFDYILTLFKSWKVILLTSIVFLLGGLSLFLFSTKTYSAKATFSVSLKNEIKTAYGKFDLKTQNPIHYLSYIELKQFKDSVLLELGESKGQYADFEIVAESIRSSDNLPTVYPNKFDLIIKGQNKDKLDSFSAKAIELLLDVIDKKIQKEMMNYFSSNLSVGIQDLIFEIGVKKEFVDVLKKSGGKKVDSEDDGIDIDKYADDRLLNRLEGNKRGLIISMILNKENGSKYYEEAVLMLEEMELRKLNNDLFRLTQLLDNLIVKDKEDALDEVFNKPFSRHFIMLTPSEVQNDIDFGKYIKRILIFFFLGFFISSIIVLIKGFYTQKIKTT